MDQSGNFDRHSEEINSLHVSMEQGMEIATSENIELKSLSKLCREVATLTQRIKPHIDTDLGQEVYTFTEVMAEAVDGLPIVDIRRNIIGSPEHQAMMRKKEQKGGNEQEKEREKFESLKLNSLRLLAMIDFIPFNLDFDSIDSNTVNLEDFDLTRLDAIARQSLSIRSYRDIDNIDDLSIVMNEILEFIEANDPDKVVHIFSHHGPEVTLKDISERFAKSTASQASVFNDRLTIAKNLIYHSRSILKQTQKSIQDMLNSDKTPPTGQTLFHYVPDQNVRFKSRTGIVGRTYFRNKLDSPVETEYIAYAIGIAWTKHELQKDKIKIKLLSAFPD